MAVGRANKVQLIGADGGDGTEASVIAGVLQTSGGGGGGGGGPATIADGADVAEGSTTDAVVAAGAAGSVSAKLRRLTTDLGALIGQIPSSLGPKSNALSLAVVQPSSATGTQSSVAGSASSVSLLASNTARIGATFFNDSAATLYLKLGATASTTSYTVQIAPNGYYEVPFRYTGAIDGIWSSATGNARITELT